MKAAVRKEEAAVADKRGWKKEYGGIWMLAVDQGARPISLRSSTKIHPRRDSASSGSWPPK